MCGVSKRFATLILIITISSLVVISPLFAQIPSTPIFSISSISGTYVIPTTFSINQYTGANISTPGYTVYSLNITFNIKSPISSFYVLQYKGHYSSQWKTLYEDGYNVTTGPSDITIFGSNATSPLGVSPANEITLYFSDDWAMNVPINSQMDFRLQAVSNGNMIRVFGGNAVVGYVSDWSESQTINLADGTVSVSPTPTSPSQTPTSVSTSSTTTNPQQLNSSLFGLDWEQIAIICLGITVVVLAFALVFSHRRNAKHIQTPGTKFTVSRAIEKMRPNVQVPQTLSTKHSYFCN